MFRKILLVTVAITALGGMASGGANVGKGNTDEDVARWKDELSPRRAACHSAAQVLIDAQEEAQDQETENGKRSVLVSGMVQALRSFVNYGADYSPLTVQALNRGFELHKIFASKKCLPSGPGSCSSVPQRADLNFLQFYVDYLINTIIPLDQDYYIIYRERCYNHPYNCLPDDFKSEYVRRYKIGAQSLLAFYMGETVDGRSNGSGMPEAFASDSFELQFAQKTFSWAADDLNEDLFRRYFVCTIDRLDSVSRRLKKHLAGVPNVYPNDTVAVTRARNVAQGTIEELRSESCVSFRAGQRW